MRTPHMYSVRIEFLKSQSCLLAVQYPQAVWAGCLVNLVVDLSVVVAEHRLTTKRPRFTISSPVLLTKAFSPLTEFCAWDYQWVYSIK